MLTLLHRLEWGTKKKRKMLEDWKAARGEYPAAFLDVPPLYSWLSWYLEAFYDLGNSRRTDQGYPQPIPVSEIESYCRFFDIDDDEVRADLFYFTGKLDEAYCGYQCSKDEEKAAFLADMRKQLKAVVPDGDS